MSEPVQILEYVTSAGTKPRCDREKGILFDVKFLGEESSNAFPNNNSYPRSVREKALPILEGRRINIDHPEKGKEGQTRAYGAGFGVARNLAEKGDGIYGECWFNPKHQLAEQVCWDSENCPNNLGFSICAHGRGKRDQRSTKFVLESIDSAESIDLVSRPATTKGIREERTPMNMTTIKALRETLKPDTMGAKFLREMEELGMGEAPMPATTDPDEALKSGFKAAIHAVIDNESLDMAAKLAKIKEILKAQEKLMGGGSEPEPKETPAEESKKPTTPDAAQVQLQEQISQLQAKETIRDLIDNAGLKFAKPEARSAFIKSLIPLTEAERKELIEERKQAAPATGKLTAPKSAAPTSKTPVQESRNGNAPANGQAEKEAPPADPRERARWLTAT